MPTVTFTVGHVPKDKGEILDAISPKPPVQAAVGINSQEYVVGTDFTSGDTLVFKIPATNKIRFAMFTNNKGAVLQYTEANIASPLAKTLTLDAAATTNIKSLIIFNT